MNDVRGVSNTESGEIIIEVKDKDGNVILSRKEKMNSYLKNYFMLVHGGILSGATIGLKDVNGNTVDTIDDIKFSSGGIEAPQGDDSFGIVVGSGSTQVSIDDYNLASKISNGTGVGQLNYGDTTLYQDYTNVPQMILEVKRSFINQSGGDITVNEIGIVLKLADSSGNNIGNFLIVRDVITATTVPNGGTLNVTYKLKVN